MLHELILALNGYPGELFCYNGANYEIANDKEAKVPLFHPSEWNVVSEILEISAHYKQLLEFVHVQQLTEVKSATPEEDDTNRTGLQYPISRSYSSSICYGIETILQNYSTVIADLELKVLNDPFITLSHVRYVCEPFRGIFRILHSFMDRIKHEKSSCLLIEILKNVYDNNIHYWETLTPLVTRAHVPLYKHITDWVVFGALPNPNTEFFIQLSKDDLDVSTDITNRSRIKIPSRKKAQRHFVNYTLVPSHFPAQLLERILFMGNSIMILEKSEKTKGSLMENQKKFLAKMKMLPTDTFRTDSLSETIEDLTLAVGKDLHRLVVTDADLMNHLLIIKDFNLGGRGELLYGFLTNIYHSLKMKTSMIDAKMLSLKNVRLDIKECFNLAAQRVQLQEDILKKIEIVVTTDPTKTDIIDKYLSEIKLNLKLEWPLHILFSTESMTGYNEMFRFLLQVRRIQIQLKAVWTETKSIFRIPIPNGPAILRINMTYFLNNFQYYLQADVLESQYAILVETIEKSDRFDQIRIALAKFQANIMVQSFRTNPALREGIQQMLDLCGKFCKHMEFLIQKFHDEGIPVFEGRSPEVDEFTADFKRRMEFLYASFRRLAGDPQFGCYLGQLLLRLDYNSYFSRETSIPALRKVSNLDVTSIS